MMNLAAAQNEVVKTEYAYKGTPISISITPTGHDRWHFNIAIQDPPPPGYGSIVGEVDKLGCPTKESVLRLAKAQAEKEINKANPHGSVSSYV